MWTNKRISKYAISIIPLILCIFLVSGNANSQCLPGSQTSSHDGTVELWIGTRVPGSIIGYDFEGSLDTYWNMVWYFNSNCSLSNCNVCAAVCMPDHWEPIGGGYIQRFHHRWPIEGCEYCNYEFWDYFDTGETVSGQGANYDYDCDGLPDIVDTHPGEAEDQSINAGVPRNGVCPFIKNPVNVATGNKYEEVTDISLPTPGIPLEFKRAYNSQLSTEGPTPIGYGWTHNFNVSLREISNTSPQEVLVIDSDGRSLYFVSTGGSGEITFNGKSGVLDKLKKVVSLNEYYLRRKETDLTYGFAYEADNKWRLAQIVDPNGNALTFDYNIPTQLTVADTFGKSLVIHYENDFITSITDPIGQSVAYEYTQYGDLWKVNYRDSENTVKDFIRYETYYEQFQDHNLREKYDTGGNLMGHWAYDDWHRVTEYYSHLSGDPEEPQEKVTLEYKLGRTEVTSITATGNHLTTYTTKLIDGIKVIEKIQGCLTCGSVEQEFAYNGLELSQTTTIDNGSRYTTEYEHYGLPYSWEIHYMREALTDPPVPEERTTTYEYTPRDGDPFLMANRTETKSSVVAGCSQSKVITTAYNTKGKVISRTETGCVLVNGSPTQVSYTTTYEYDNGIPSGPGQLTKINGPRTGVNITNFVYYPNTSEYVDEDSDKRGRLQFIKKRVSQDLELITEFLDYDKNGNLTQVKDLNGVITEYTYDERNRIKTIKNLSTNAQTEYFYDARGNLDHIILPELNGVYFSYNAANKMEMISDQLGNKILYKYNKEGNKEREEIWTPPEAGYPDGMLMKQLEFAYDEYNRLKQIINPDSSYAGYWYDGRGNRITVKEPKDIPPTDPPTIPPSNPPTNYNEYEYDPLNRLKKMTQPGNVFTDYAYDTHDNLNTVVDPNGNTTTYINDDFGRKNKTVSPDTGTTWYEYDGAGNLVKRTDAKGAVVNYVYDGQNRLTNIDFPGSSEDIAFTYDSASVEKGKGRLTGRTDPSGTYTFHYHPDGRLKKEEKTITGGGSYTTQYEYNKNGVLTKITYPTGRVINYDPDSTDKTRISHVRINDSSTLVASGITYLPFGGVTGLVYGNNLTLTQGYDYQYRVSPIQVSSIHNLNYEYDANGNITSIVDLLNPSGGQDSISPRLILTSRGRTG